MEPIELKDRMILKHPLLGDITVFMRDGEPAVAFGVHEGWIYMKKEDGAFAYGGVEMPPTLD